MVVEVDVLDVDDVVVDVDVVVVAACVVVVVPFVAEGFDEQALRPTAETTANRPPAAHLDAVAMATPLVLGATPIECRCPPASMFAHCPSKNWQGPAHHKTGRPITRRAETGRDRPSHVLRAASVDRQEGR